MKSYNPEHGLSYTHDIDVTIEIKGLKSVFRLEVGGNMYGADLIEEILSDLSSHNFIPTDVDCCVEFDEEDSFFYVVLYNEDTEEVEEFEVASLNPYISKIEIVNYSPDDLL